MKAITAAAVATEFILTVTLITGIFQAIRDFKTYGATYIETVIINGVESTRTISWKDSVFTIAILLWLIILYIFFIYEVHRKEIAQTE